MNPANNLFSYLDLAEWCWTRIDDAKLFAENRPAFNQRLKDALNYQDEAVEVGKTLWGDADPLVAEAIELGQDYRREIINILGSIPP